MHHPLFSALICFVVGLLLGEKLPFSPWSIWVGLLVCGGLGALLWSRDQRRLATTFLFVGAAAAGCLRFQLASIRLDPLHYTHSDESIRGEFRLVIPDRARERADGPLLYGDLISVQESSGRRGLTGRVRIQPRRNDPLTDDLKAGDIVEVRGRIAISNLVLPWRELDRIQDRRRGIVGQVKCHRLLKVTGHRAPSPLRTLASNTRGHILEMLERTHPPEVAEFVQAILLSGRRLSADVREDFRRSGAYHLLAVSGLHVGILCLVLFGIFRMLAMPRRLSSLLVLVALGVYCLVVGSGSSVLRATLMIGIFLIGRILDRPVSLYTSLALAAGILLMYDPFSLYDPGFQLTVLTTLGLIYLTPTLMGWLDFLPTHLAALLATSLAAALSALPVMVESFGLVVLVGPITNLVALPLFGVILPVAFLACLGSVVSPWASFFFGAANYGFINLLFLATHLMARMPLACLEVEPMGLTFWGFYGLGLVVLGDMANFKAAIRPLVDGAQPSPIPDVEGIPTRVLDRTARELKNLVPDQVEDPQDILRAKLVGSRDEVLDQIPHLAADFVREYELCVKQVWRRPLDSLTVAYLALSAAYFVGSRSSDKRPSVLYLLLALQQELDVHLFAPMRSSAHLLRAQGLKEHARDHPLVVYLLDPPKSLPLKAQNTLLWTMVTTSEPRMQRLVRSISKDLSRRIEDVSFFFSPSRLPLGLDQIVKKYHDRLDKDEWSWEAVRRAREEILGPKGVNLFEEIGLALGTEDPTSAGWLKGVIALDDGDAPGKAQLGNSQSGKTSLEESEPASMPPMKSSST